MTLDFKKIRVAWFFVCLLLIVLFPWWVGVVGIGVGIIAYGNYWEGVALGIIIDLLYLPGRVPMITIGIILAIIVASLISQFIRREKMWIK